MGATAENLRPGLIQVDVGSPACVARRAPALMLSRPHRLERLDG